MRLYINSIKNGGSDIEARLTDRHGNRVTKIREAQYRQAERLLPLIEELLQENEVAGEEITEITVENGGGTFTSVRIGVVTANALGYAWGIPVKGTHPEGQKEITLADRKMTLASPVYNKEPNITPKGCG